MLQLGLNWIPLKGVFIDSSIRSIPNKAMSEDVLLKIYKYPLLRAQWKCNPFTGSI